MTIIKLITHFLDYTDVEKGLSKKTQENYARCLERFRRWLVDSNMQNLLPHELTSEIVWQYRLFLSRKAISKKTKAELSKKTQNMYLIALRGLLSYFSVRDIPSLSPDKIRLAKQEKNHSVHFLSLEKVKRLLDSPAGNDLTSKRDKAILESLFSTGFRVSELVQLDRDHISVKNTNKVVEYSVTGKGNKTRTVYFSLRALSAIQAYLGAREDIDQAMFINYSPTAPDVGSRRLTARSIERIVKKYVKLAGLPLNTTPHTLRHSFATDLLNQGVDIRMVQEFLGHEDISTTQIYTHVTNKNLRDIYTKFHGGKRSEK
ncbi:tyrosine-type recombinase/integrase [Candidatus Kuenenbacteria bacterium]|nr:tyrosine-type recombinase/integrase [Candidatus Kuenenbacteria bacterium]